MTAKKRGRPEFVATDEDRHRVRVLKAGGMSAEAIAEAINVSEPTLRKYFALDLEIGAAKVTAEMLMARYNAGIGGNVTAQNKWLEATGALPPKPRREAKAPAKGKKEVLDEEAQVSRASPGWGDVLQ